MEIGNKTGLKLIITVVIVTLAMFVFNTNIVKAVETYDYYNLVDKGPIYDDKNSSISMNDGLSKYSYYVDFDTFDLYNLSKDSKTLNELADDEGYVYQMFYMKLSDEVEEVIDVDNNQNLNIINSNGIKYLGYNLKIFEKTSNKYLPAYSNYELNLKIKDNNNEENKKICISYYPAETASQKNYIATLDTISEDNKYIGEDVGEYYGKTNSGYAGWAEADFTTASDYSNGFYKLCLSVNVGKSIYVDKLGTSFEYIGTEHNNEWNENLYVYKAKIPETTIFAKAQKIDILLDLIDTNTNQGSYSVIEMNIVGNTRQTYEVNADNNTKISINGATDIGVELKADIIDENNNTYIEMTNSIINTEKYINIGAYDIKLVGGQYEGDLVLTFDLGTENNGKKVHVWHKTSSGKIEEFNEIVTDGKVTIKVTELSPFLLAYEKSDETIQEIQNSTTETEQENTEHVLDNEPKTGIIDIKLFIGIALIILVIGIVSNKKKDREV